MKWGRYLNRGCVSTVLIVALSVGFCMPPVVTGTSAILCTESNAEVPKWASAKPTWAKLFCKYSWAGFSGRLWRRASEISGLRVCPVCHTLQAEATYVFVYFLVWRPVKRNLSLCFFSRSIVFLWIIGYVHFSKMGTSETSRKGAWHELREASGRLCQAGSCGVHQDRVWALKPGSSPWYCFSAVSHMGT